MSDSESDPPPVGWDDMFVPEEKIPEPPKPLRLAELFTFPGWNTTLLANILPELFSVIVSYSRKPIGAIKENYKFKFCFGGMGRTEEMTKFHCPHGAAFNRDGLLFVADSRNHLIKVWNAAGEYVKSIGKGWGHKKGHFNLPIAVCFDHDDNLIVADRGDHRVQIFDTVSGEALLEFGEKGTNEGDLFEPSCVVVNEEGNILVAERENCRVSMFTPKGEWIKCFGKGRPSWRGDGDLGQLSEPFGVAIDRSDGTILVCENGSSRVTRFDKEGNPLQIVIQGCLAQPCGVSVDRHGNILVVDNNNSVIRIFDKQGQPLQVFPEGGTKSINGNTPGELKNPRTVDLDLDGNLYITEHGSHRISVFG